MRYITTQGYLALVVLCLSSLCARGQSEHGYQFETINGNDIAWSCSGKGDPTIVLIAGMGLAAHPSFDRIYHGYEGDGRICMYDRAGIGESTFAQAKQRSLADLVGELHALSIRRNWSPAIVVAHSFGGFIARAYAATHPGDVLGIVFLDVAHGAVNEGPDDKSGLGDHGANNHLEQG